jgi:ribonuclease G
VPTILTLINREWVDEAGSFWGVCAAVTIGLPLFAYGNIVKQWPLIVSGSLLTILLPLAAILIARKLRLRNVGGLIFGDFIDMKCRKDQQAVYNLMKERLKRDKAKTHVLPISPLGLMEMTRQRAQESLSDTIFENCPYCQGRGVVKTSMSTSVELHRTLNTVMRKYQDSVHDIRVILNPDVLKRLKAEDEELLIELERRYAGRLMFRADPSYHHEKFTVTDANSGAELKA